MPCMHARVPVTKGIRLLVETPAIGSHVISLVFSTGGAYLSPLVSHGRRLGSGAECRKKTTATYQPVSEPPPRACLLPCPFLSRPHLLSLTGWKHNPGAYFFAIREEKRALRASQANSPASPGSPHSSIGEGQLSTAASPRSPHPSWEGQNSIAVSLPSPAHHSGQGQPGIAGPPGFPQPSGVYCVVMVPGGACLPQVGYYPPQHGTYTVGQVSGSLLYSCSRHHLS
jgi:hypothetical protein